MSTPADRSRRGSHITAHQSPPAPRPGCEQRQWPIDNNSRSSPRQFNSYSVSQPPSVDACSPGVHSGHRLGSLDGSAPETANDADALSSSFSQQTTLCQQSTPSGATELPAASETDASTIHDAGLVVSNVDFDNGAYHKTQLATCEEVNFAPSTRKLLEDCKTNRGGFLRTIKQFKAVLPTGQGWKAAIAAKKENADMRDIIKIYHRFECYNIYRHVVEAGFHTGVHWVRDMRSELIKKLCQDFPERFQSQKVANKCLNWVDQGCKFHEWTEMFGESSNLGYLIALPTEVPHSAYVPIASGRVISSSLISLQVHIPMYERANEFNICNIQGIRHL